MGVNPFFLATLQNLPKMVEMTMTVRLIVHLSALTVSIWLSHGTITLFMCMTLAIWSGDSYMPSNIIIPTAKSPGVKALELLRLSGSRALMDGGWASFLVAMTVNGTRSLPVLETHFFKGCVRLWDVCQAMDNPANGRVIAETDFDIAHFSIGDKSKGEAPLVM